MGEIRDTRVLVSSNVMNRLNRLVRGEDTDVVREGSEFYDRDKKFRVYVGFDDVVSEEHIQVIVSDWKGDEILTEYVAELYDGLTIFVPSEYGLSYEILIKEFKV